MDFIEFKLLSGNTVSVRKNLVMAVTEYLAITDEMRKQLPFLKHIDSFTMIEVNYGPRVAPQVLYCREPYAAVMQKLK